MQNWGSQELQQVIREQLIPGILSSEFLRQTVSKANSKDLAYNSDYLPNTSVWRERSVTQPGDTSCWCVLCFRKSQCYDISSETLCDFCSQTLTQAPSLERRDQCQDLTQWSQVDRDPFCWNSLSTQSSCSEAMWLQTQREKGAGEIKGVQSPSSPHILGASFQQQVWQIIRQRAYYFSCCLLCPCYVWHSVAMWVLEQDLETEEWVIVMVFWSQIIWVQIPWWNLLTYWAAISSGGRVYDIIPLSPQIQSSDMDGYQELLSWTHSWSKGNEVNELHANWLTFSRSSTHKTLLLLLAVVEGTAAGLQLADLKMIIPWSSLFSFVIGFTPCQL